VLPDTSATCPDVSIWRPSVLEGALVATRLVVVTELIPGVELGGEPITTCGVGSQWRLAIDVVIVVRLGSTCANCVVIDTAALTDTVPELSTWPTGEN